MVKERFGDIFFRLRCCLNYMLVRTSSLQCCIVSENNRLIEYIDNGLLLMQIISLVSNTESMCVRILHFMCVFVCEYLWAAHWYGNESIAFVFVQITFCRHSLLKINSVSTPIKIQNYLTKWKIQVPYRGYVWCHFNKYLNEFERNLCNMKNAQIWKIFSCDFISK